MNIDWHDATGARCDGEREMVMARKDFSGAEWDGLRPGTPVQVLHDGAWHPATVLDRPAYVAAGWASVRVRYHGPTTERLTHGETWGFGPGEVRPEIKGY